MDSILSRVLEAEAPSDLRRWAGTEQLVNLILHEVLGPNQSGANATTREIFLGLLTYSYCIGLYDSAEIAGRVEDIPGALARGLHETVSAGSLRYFRRMERETLRKTLARTFAAAWHSTTRSDSGPAPDFEAEAAHRIDRAIQWDSWIGDGE
jgi:hypothetical protein